MLQQTLQWAGSAYLINDRGYGWIEEFPFWILAAADNQEDSPLRFPRHPLLNS
jgi:hypothetical protein